MRAELSLWIKGKLSCCRIILWLIFGLTNHRRHYGSRATETMYCIKKFITTEQNHQDAKTSLRSKTHTVSIQKLYPEYVFLLFIDNAKIAGQFRFFGCADCIRIILESSPPMGTSLRSLSTFSGSPLSFVSSNFNWKHLLFF